MLRERKVSAGLPRHHVLLQGEQVQRVQTAESQRGSSKADSRQVVVFYALFAGDIDGLAGDHSTPAAGSPTSAVIRDALSGPENRDFGQKMLVFWGGE